MSPMATDASSGNFDFRSVLRKTNLLSTDNYDKFEQQKLQQQHAHANEIQQVDFRSVLRRKVVS